MSRPLASLVCASLVAAASVGRAAPLAVRCDPPTLLVGAGVGARVEVDAAEEELPRILASAGRIENARAVQPGRFEADYLPPREGYPQVAVVAAVAGERWAWTALPLSGRGVAVARSAPGASIRVRIGEAWFGPVRADATGEARVPVIVPPGVDVAYHREKPLVLDVPRTAHVFVALGRGAAVADTAHEISVRVFAVTRAGAPRAAAPVALAVTQGRVEGLEEVAPGEWSGRWILAAGPTGTAMAEARLGDEPGVTSAATLERPAGPPARLAIVAGRTRAAAGEREPVSLRVSVADAAGNAVAAEPTLAATAGTVSRVAAAEPGAWEALLAVPEVPGRVDVIARAAGLEQRVAIDVVAPPTAPPPTAPTVAPPCVRRLSLAPKLGIAVSAGGMRAAAASVESVWVTRLLDGRVAVAAEVGTFVRERSDAVQLDAQVLAVRGRARYVPITGSVRLLLAPAARQAAWIALGAGIAAVGSEVAVEGGAIRSESGAAPVAELSAGWGLRVGRLVPFAEARLARFGDPGFEALQGGLGVLTLAIGCRYDAF